MSRYYLILLLLCCVFCCCQPKEQLNATLPHAGAFTDTVDGRPCGYYVIHNSMGIRAAFSTYGARMIRLLVPGKQGRVMAVVKGYDSLAQYLHSANKGTGVLKKGYGLRHWNAVQPNDSTLDLSCDTLKLTCGLQGNSFRISTNQANDSLLQVAALFSAADKRLGLAVSKEKKHHQTAITCTFVRLPEAKN